MAHYDIFREQLAIKYSAHGHALWEPSPWKPDRPVEVGDVGFIRNGRFHSLFNALRPATGQPNLPEDYEQLIPKFSDHISRCSLSSNHYCSAGISVEPEPECRASSPDEFRQVSFRYPRKRGGAVLSLPVKARREDTLAKGDFGAWMVTHIDRLFAFARGLGLGIEQMEEIALVTGCDHTRSWTNVAFFGNEYNARATFGVKVVHRPAISIQWQSSPEHVQGAVLNQGPDGTGLPEDQCVFIRGFRVARTFRILPKHLKAAAGPSPDQDDGYDHEPNIGVISIPAVPKYRDPLYILLDYIAEMNMFLIHDDDLKWIDGIGDDTSPEPEALQSDVVMDLLRRSNIEINIVQCDLPHISSNPSSNAEVVSIVAMFSEQNLSRIPQLQPSSLAAQSTSPLHVSESSVLPPQLPPEQFPALKEDTRASDAAKSTIDHADAPAITSRQRTRPPSPGVFKPDTDYPGLGGRPDLLNNQGSSTSHTYLQQRDLFADGYIAQMFGPLDSEAYHISLLRREPGPIQWHTNVTGAFMAAPPPRPEYDQDDWIIDYAIRDNGPVIRQKIWAPKKTSDRVRRVDHEQLHRPIFFLHKDGRRLGLPLIEAAGGNFVCLLGAEEAAPVGISAHAQIRINWSGYLHLNWNEQIPIQKKTESQEIETISLQKFAKHVGKKVLKFMVAAKDEANINDQRYLIGDQHITPDDIILIGVVHVSQGSWMPILQLNNEQWYSRHL